MMYFLSASCALLVGLSSFLAYAYYKLGVKVLELEEQVEDSLDILDECYTRVSDVVSMPIASDDPNVMAVVNDVRSCKEAILVVANKITTFSEQR